MLSSVLLFLNIGTPEMMLILFVALLLFGGDKLPGLARGLGKGIRDFKDASEGVKREITNQINSYEDKKAEEQFAANDHLVEGEPAAHEYPSFDAHVANSTPTFDGHVANTIPAGETPVANDIITENHAEASNVNETIKAPGKEGIKSHEEYKS